MNLLTAARQIDPHDAEKNGKAWETRWLQRHKPTLYQIVWMHLPNALLFGLFAAVTLLMAWVICHC